MAAGEDTDPIPPDVATSAALGARAFRRVDTCVTVTTGEVVVHNEFYACKFRAAFENRFGTSWLTPAVLVHPSMKIADDSRRSVALRNAEGRLKDGERRGRTRSVTPGEGRCVALETSSRLVLRLFAAHNTHRWLSQHIKARRATGTSPGSQARGACAPAG